jgi:hypothetical protein
VGPTAIECLPELLGWFPHLTLLRLGSDSPSWVVAALAASMWRVPRLDTVDMSTAECYGVEERRTARVAPLDATAYIDLASAVASATAAGSGRWRLSTFLLSPLYSYAHLERLVEHVGYHVPDCTIKWVLPLASACADAAAALALDDGDE